MTFKAWKHWFYHLPWSLRWFVVLVLLRPAIDNFYFLKEISPFLSPLYIVGVLTPFLAIFSLSRLKRPIASSLDIYFKFWSILIILSVIFLLVEDPESLRTLELLFKLTLPVYLYFYLRAFIRSKEDLDGILFTFLYSCILVSVLFLYELIINPIRIEYSRGQERIMGNFADVMNYATYLTFGLLVCGYYYFHPGKNKSFLQKNRNILLVFILGVLMLFKINHVATFVVFLALFGLFFLFLLQRKQVGILFFLMAGGLVLYSFGAGESVTKRVNPLIETDLAVYEGDRAERFLLHGRVGRWQYIFEDYGDNPVAAILLGLPLRLKGPYFGLAISAHNDFIRILLLTGIVGLASYLAILYNLYRKIRYLWQHDRFLGYGALLIVVIYSVTLTPTMYANMLYVVFAIFAYMGLPQRKIISA